MTRIALISTSDTDLLSARAAGSDPASGVDYALANPNRLRVADAPTDGAAGPGTGAESTDTVAAGAAAGMAPEQAPRTSLEDVLAGADLVVVRILGTARTWQDGLDAIRARDLPMVVLGGEQTPDAELMSSSTVPVGVAAQAHQYLAEGGPANLTQLHAFLADTVLLTGDEFDPPEPVPAWGWLDRPDAPVAGQDDDRLKIGILFYRAHASSGNDDFAHALADAVDAVGDGHGGGVAVGLPIFSSSLRSAPDELYAALEHLDALVVTVLAAGGITPAGASAGGDDEAWDVQRMAALDIPVLQGLCLTSPREEWAGNDAGVTPLDSANQVAIPEFDGRIITVPFSFKETDPADPAGLPRYVADPERARRVAELAVNHARLRQVPRAERRLALVMSAYPTKHSRVGNAVGLDTPASTIRLLRSLREAGYDLGPADGPITRLLDLPEDGTDAADTRAGNALMHTLIAAGGQDEEWLTQAQLDEGHVRITGEQYRRWTADVPPDLAQRMIQAWGEAPGTVFVTEPADGGEGEIVLATLRAGNVVLLIQPPRGFGENPIAIYHDPDLAPTHHYLAAYRWLENAPDEGGFGAHAVVHLGKHGSLEWLPGKDAALSACCAPDQVLGSLPMVYPFLVNDPGEGAQAKRRAHATIVDHLIPPMARAESYGDLARLEQLMDEYANIAAMDPAKLPAIRQEIWTLLKAAEMHHDLGIAERPDDEEFDDFLLHVDGWLCEVKDVQIRDGLHVLGQAPVGEERVTMVLAVLRAAQVWGGEAGAVPGLRRALGLAEDAPVREVDAVEARARALVEALEKEGWDPDRVAGVVGQLEPDAEESVTRVLDFAAREVVPRLAGTDGELDAVLHALDGGFVPAGPSGSPLRGLVNVLPTGRNFYTVDPRAVPSRLAYETGQRMADSLLERYLAETGDYPRSVGLSAWGTSAMRTAGDDIAEVLALIGVRPRWDEASRRVSDLEVVPLAELDRPRIDVTVRISGFFRDAFPHVLTMLDDAIRMVADLDEPDEHNFVRAHARTDAAGTDTHRAATRIFGSAPGTYGAGILQAVESGHWRDDADLAEVYTAWGGYAYGRDLDGVAATEEMRTAYRRIAVAAKNVDSAEHDIADSDDYFQYHGGMVATVRALTGADPRAYVGDSTSPDQVRTRTLSEETARVFRARVVNPRWIAAMQRHGYKGAFELAATVDYLYGFDATAGVVQDWMYERLAQEYVLDEDRQQFLREANPWALHGIVERLHEAVDRGLWESPDQQVLAQLQQVYLETEGELEDKHE